MHLPSSSSGRRFLGLTLACAGLFVSGAGVSAFAQGTAFTYQGRLESSAAPANGSYDFRFRLAVDALGNTLVAGPVLVNGVAVTNGLFTVGIDFGTGTFNGTNYWLEIDVRTNGTGAYSALSPLQPLTPAPYALYAAKSSSALVASNVVTYTAGAGLLLSGGQFQANFSTNGLSNQVARDDHSHFGHYWHGSTSGNGLTVGNLDASSTYSSAINGFNMSPNGYGLYGRQGAGSGVAARPAAVVGDGDATYGISATSRSNSAIFADSYNADSAIYAWSHGTAGGFGVHAIADNGHGVVGQAMASSGGFYGVYGNSASSNGHGVDGYASASSGTTCGVYGEASSPSGTGVSGTGGTFGVQGQGTTGVYGTSSLASGNGVIGECNNGPYAYGVWGKSSSGFAGYFSGNVTVTGTLSKGAGSFQIDDPLDPTNKFLFHSFVESPDMKNIYDGVVTLDAQGEAVWHCPRGLAR